MPSDRNALGIAADLERLVRLECGLGTTKDVAEADWMLEAGLPEALAAIDLAGLGPAHAIDSMSGGQRTRFRRCAAIARHDEDFLDAVGTERRIAFPLESATAGAAAAFPP